MKKLLSFLSGLLSFAIIACMVMSVAYAMPEFDSSKPYFQIQSVTASAGDEVTVSVNVGNNPGFYAVKLSVTYDDGLSFVKQNGEPVINTSSAFSSKGSVVTNYDCSVLTYLYTANDFNNVTENGEFFNFKIKVDKGAVTGDYKVSFVDYSSSNFIDSNGDKVSFTFGDAVVSVNGKTTTLTGQETETSSEKFLAYNCSPTGDATIGTYNQTDITPNGTLSLIKTTSKGQYVQYTLSDVKADKYSLKTISRVNPSGRGIFDIYVNNELLNTVDFNDTFGSREDLIGEFELEQDGDVTVKFVVGETTGTMYLHSFVIQSMSGIRYEEKTEDIYTMDEGFVPDVYGVTRDYPNVQGVKNVSDNNVLAFSKSVNGKSLVNRSVYFKLPDDIFERHENLVKLEISLKTDTGTFYSNNKGYNRIYMSSYPTENPTSSNSVKIANEASYSISTTFSTFSIDFSTEKGNLIKSNDYLYFNIINSVENNNNNNFVNLYIDNVELIYSVPVDTKTVTINSVEKTVNTGEEFVLPDNDNTALYTDQNGNIYSCGESVVINEDMTFTSIDVDITTKSQASMRLNNDEVSEHITGIRFYTQVDTSAISSLRQMDGVTVEMGTLITPKKYFGSRPFDDLKFGVDFGKRTNYANVPFTSETYYSDEDGFVGIVGSIINIKDNNAMTDFVARGYVKVTVNGNEKIIYANSNDLPVRSIGYLAYCISKDTGYYNTLDENRKYLVDYYCGIYNANNVKDDPYGEDIF